MTGQFVTLIALSYVKSLKIAPYRDKMSDCIAQCLGIATENVQVKATTTEKLGFTGRGEGIAALATCLVMKD